MLERTHRAAAPFALALALGAALPAIAQQGEPPQPRPPAPGAYTPPFDAEAQLLLGEWRVTGIAGHPVVRGSGARLKLEGVRISGQTGCNHLGGNFRIERGHLTTGGLITTRRACSAALMIGGNFRIERGHLTTGGLITTRRACSAALMRQEKALLALLNQRLAIRQSHRGRLLLTGRDGKTLVLVRAT